MYAESSNSSLINNDFGLEASSSRRKPALIDDDVDGDASSDVTDILPQSHLTVPPDENSLLNMSAEEQIFYENFKDGIIFFSLSLSILFLTNWFLCL